MRRGSDGEPPPLFPLEQAILGSQALQRRRSHFALGRAAARDALVELGLAPTPIGRGPEREPLWPEGIVGTISHSGDLALAIVGWRSDYAGLGVDIEGFSPGVSARALRLVCTASERVWLACRPENWRTVLFSAKEAVFKALFPIERVWLGFADAELTFDDAAGAFEARLLKSAGAEYPVGTRLRVQCTLAEREVLSVTYVESKFQLRIHS
jgi:4'-phosphopantetheinyl transferase EntD